MIHQPPRPTGQIEIRHPLLSDEEWGACKSTVAACAFGLMVEACEGITREYRGDLYHDALALKLLLDAFQEMDIYFTARPFGTWWHRDCPDSIQPGEYLYRVTYVPIHHGSFTAHDVHMERYV